MQCLQSTRYKTETKHGPSNLTFATIVTHITHIDHCIFTNLDFADDIAMPAANRDELISLLCHFFAAEGKMGIQVSWAKTKIQSMGPHTPTVDAVIDGHNVESVRSFWYLGGTVHSTDGCSPDVHCRIGIAVAVVDTLARIGHRISCGSTKLASCSCSSMVRRAWLSGSILPTGFPYALPATHPGTQVAGQGYERLSCVKNVTASYISHSGCAPDLPIRTRRPAR